MICQQSEEEEEEEVTKEFKSVEAAAVEMENGRRLEEGKEGWKKGVGQQDQRVDEMDGRNALVEEDQGAEFDEAEARRMEQVITQELDPEDSELVVINYSETTNSDTDIRHSEIVPINEATREEEKTLPMEEEEGEEEDVDGVIAEERIRQTEELAQEQVSKEEDVVENEKADEESRSVTDGEQGTQTEGEADVHVDITADEVSHTLTAKANTLPADTSRVEPYGMDQGSSTMSRRDTGGALSKIKKDDFRKVNDSSFACITNHTTIGLTLGIMVANCHLEAELQRKLASCAMSISTFLPFFLLMLIFFMFNLPSHLKSFLQMELLFFGCVKGFATVKLSFYCQIVSIGVSTQ